MQYFNKLAIPQLTSLYRFAMDLGSHYSSLASKTAVPWWASPAVEEHLVEMVEEKLNLESVSLLADLGAGSGAFASHLSTRAGSVVCPDIGGTLLPG